MIQTFWNKHPILSQIIQVVREGQWITHVFEWLFMMVSRLTGYAMTLAIGYLIYYAIEFKHSLDAVIAHPGFADNLASYSNVIINVGPELVFPGVVVLCIRSLTARRWLDGTLYLVTTILFVTLTMVLLNAFMDNQITAGFLAAMLFWRAFASLWYTVVAAYCGGHGGLDLRGLLRELDTLREQLDSGQQRVSTLEQHLSTAQQQASSVQHEVSTLRTHLDSSQQRVSSLEQELDTEHAETAGLRRDLEVARDEVESLRTRLEAKQREVDAMQADQEAVVSLRRELQAARLHADDLQAHLDTKQQELSTVQAAPTGEQATVSSLRREVSSGQQQRASSLVGVQASSGQQQVDTTRKSRDWTQPVHVSPVGVNEHLPNRSGRRCWTSRAFLGGPLRPGWRVHPPPPIAGKPFLKRVDNYQMS